MGQESGTIQKRLSIFTDGICWGSWKRRDAMKSYLGIIFILFGVLSFIFLWGASARLESAGEQLSQIQSENGNTVVQALTNQVGEVGIGLSFALKGISFFVFTFCLYAGLRAFPQKTAQSSPAHETGEKPLRYSVDMDHLTPDQRKLVEYCNDRGMDEESMKEMLFKTFGKRI